MPVSRNRKKKSNQNNRSEAKVAPPIRVHELFKLQTNPCRKYGGEIDEFNSDKLPNDQQLHWEKSGIVNEINCFLYCPDCNEYSAIFEIEEF